MTPLLAQRLRTDRSFERLYRRYAGDVYHYALAVCRHAADAEDVTQTTFMNAYRAVSAGEQPRTPKNWLLAIAHNVMRQRFRQRARRPDEVGLDDSVGATVSDDEGYSADEIRRALGELAFNQRAALVMRELEGRSYADIAAILDVSVSAVETLLFRARRALREQLEGTLTCREAELAISRQLDGRLSRAEKGSLRAHLRVCSDCGSFARSQRAQRAALKGLAAIPLPASLTSLFGGGAAVGTGIAVKAAAVTAVGLLVSGAGLETAHVVRHQRPAPVAARADVGAAATTKNTSAVQNAAAAIGVERAHRILSPVRTRGASSQHASHTRLDAPAQTPGGALRAKPIHPTHPAHPTQAASPAHSTQTSHPAHPTKPATAQVKPKKAHPQPAHGRVKPRPARSRGKGKPSSPPTTSQGTPASQGGGGGQGNSTKIATKNP